MLTANNIKVTLGRREILHGVDFIAKPGELTVIIGPNGSGKTTLMRALTGEIDYGGDVSLNGQDIRRQLPWQLAAIRGVLPQSTPLSFPFTVLEIVRLGLHASPDAERNRLPTTALEAVGLSDFEGRFYQELSGGEQQRVQLARVLCQVWSPLGECGPRWLFLDEPVSSLDIGHQLMIMRLAKDYARRGGGVVAVMHDLNMTAMHADRLALVSDGRIVAHGTPGEVLTDHNLQTAYHCALRVNTTPGDGLYVLPHSAA